MTAPDEVLVLPESAVVLSGAACAALVPALADPAVRAQLSILGAQTVSLILTRGRAWLHEADTSDTSECGTVVALPVREHSDLTEIDTATAAEMLGCSARWVRMLAERGDLAGRYSGRGWTFRRGDVGVYMGQRGGRS